MENICKRLSFLNFIPIGVLLLGLFLFRKLTPEVHVDHFLQQPGHGSLATGFKGLSEGLEGHKLRPSAACPDAVAGQFMPCSFDTPKLGGPKGAVSRACGVTRVEDASPSPLSLLAWKWP